MQNRQHRDRTHKTGPLYGGLCIALSLLVSACNMSTAPNGLSATSPARVKNTPGSAPAMLADEARILLDQGRPEAALPIYRHLVRGGRAPQHVAGMAEALLTMGRAEDALNILDTTTAHHVDVYLVRGEAELATGAFRSALASFDQALLLGGGEAALTGRGIAYTAIGESEAALADFRQVSPPVGPSNEALVMIIMGRHEEAIGLLETLIETGDAGPRDRQNLVFAYVATGRDREARRLAHIDLDSVTARQTIGYYRMLATLTPQRRVDSLLLGVVAPGETLDEAANYRLADASGQIQARADAAGNRLLAERRGQTPTLFAEAVPAPAAEIKAPEAAPSTGAPTTLINGEDLSDLDPETIPPILERDGWAVQIGAYRTLRRLTRGWQQLQSANTDILADIPPRRSEIEYAERTKTGKHGFYYRLNAGPLKDLSQAKALCAALSQRGTACWVRPPEDSERLGPNPAMLTANAAS